MKCVEVVRWEWKMSDGVMEGNGKRGRGRSLIPK
jgi:hypothetical protein